MKKFFSTLSLLILPLLFASSAQAQDPCQPGFELIVEDDGNIICREINLRCPGGNDRGYVDNNNAHLCCPTQNQLVIYNDNTRVGACCGDNQVYTGVKPDGKCCPPKSVLNKDKQCIPAPPPSTCQGCPAQPPGACQLQAACGDNTKNGLQYGKCYQLLFPTGKQLGRGPPYGNDDMYTQDGHIQNIPYQVCKTATDCGTGAVQSTDSFYIKDLVGPASGAAPFGWMSNSLNGAHMTITTSANPADYGQFKGRTSCWSCKCVIQLTSMGYACPNVQPGITFWANPKINLKLQFLEIPCDGKFGFQ
ncbi:hypothetical protein L218DRAFT_628164 [Marasmius fiardii PR-910]|nr:hypothetical protein L218DRAFT_628164 [Marasmius fiardii PR-910]